MSVATLLPGCADEPDLPGEGEQDAGIAPGVVVSPDAGHSLDAAYPQGVLPYPYDAGIIVQPDAAARDADTSDASCDDLLPVGLVAQPIVPPGCNRPPVDAGCSVDAAFLNGIVIHPADAGCKLLYPGVVVRSNDE